MKIKFIIPLALAAFMTQGCSTVKTETMWVGGLKTECNAGNLEAECLSVNKGEDLTTTSWENFYADIEGFEFEEGYMKKIEVEAIQLDPKDVPADASSIQYKFVKELEKKKDPRSSLSGNWILATINGGPINKMVVVPNLSVDLKEMRIAGNAGCNRYFAGIEGLSTQKITFSQAGATIVMCILICIVITTISMLNAFISCDSDKILLMKSMHANKFQILFKLIIPNSIPEFTSVLKINVGMSWVGTIMGEYLSSKAGLGYLINYGSQILKLDIVMASITLLCILAGGMYFLVSILERKYNK